MDRQKAFFRWMLYTNYDDLGMYGLIIEAAQSGTYINPTARCSYVRPHASTKGGKKKAEYIPVNMHQGHRETKQLKDKYETPTFMVHSEQINKTTTLLLPTEEEWIQGISEDYDFGYIKRILYSTEETHIEPKELRNKGYVKPFQQERLGLDNGLIPY